MQIKMLRRAYLQVGLNSPECFASARNLSSLINAHNNVNNANTKYKQLESTIRSINVLASAGGSKMFSTKECVLPKFGGSKTAKMDAMFDRRQVKSKNDSQPSHNSASCHVEAEYEEAIMALNLLQSNADTIRRSIALNNKQTPLDDMYLCLERSGLSLADLEQMSFIHVAGSKGKGSTCALTESILRAHGNKTGFYSSPHLCSVTERIRINGAPISKAEFVKAFWPVYRRLEATKATPHDMPAYFKFLTILSFHIFRAQQVDVVILEVGIGGELDCTNIIRNTKTVGITSLGLEHTQLLGSTLAEIAWQKAGIIKPYADVFTTATQPECLQVLQARATEKQANVHVVPPYTAYSHDAVTSELLDSLNNVTQLNGSLAIQLAYDWLRKQRPACQYELNSTAPLSESVLTGLRTCSWPGRCQMIPAQNMNIHLDGAHTLESMAVCSDWFSRLAGSSKHPKVLIFNTTGDRDSKKLLEIVRRSIQFDHACFVPNIANGRSNRNDMQSVYGISDQIKRAKMHAGNWYLLSQEEDETDNSRVYGSVVDALRGVQKRYSPKQQVDVLVTGSLHLIGATLLALEELLKRGELT